MKDPKTGVKKLVYNETNSMYDFANFYPTPVIFDLEEREAMMKENLETFSTWYPMMLFLCGSLCYSVALKMLFNTLARPGADFKVPIDRWTKLDLISAVATLIGFSYILQE